MFAVFVIHMLTYSYLYVIANAKLFIAGYVIFYHFLNISYLSRNTVIQIFIQKLSGIKFYSYFHFLAKLSTFLKKGMNVRTFFYLLKEISFFSLEIFFLIFKVIIQIIFFYRSVPLYLYICLCCHVFLKLHFFCQLSRIVSNSCLQ